MLSGVCAGASIVAVEEALVGVVQSNYKAAAIGHAYEPEDKKSKTRSAVEKLELFQGGDQDDRGVQGCWIASKSCRLCQCLYSGSVEL